MKNNLNIQEVAKLAGKSDTTIYRMINSGKLSATKDAENNFKVDLSELHRVFPNLKNTYQEVSNNENILKNRITYLELELQHKDQIIALKNENILNLKDNINDLKENCENLKHSLFLLEIPSNKKLQHEKHDQQNENQKKIFWKKIFNKK